VRGAAAVLTACAGAAGNVPFATCSYMQASVMLTMMLC
jgi:hypothetical protein